MAQSDAVITGEWPLQSLHDLTAASPSCSLPQPPAAEADADACGALAHPLARFQLPRLTARAERRMRSLYCGLLLRCAALLELPAPAGAAACVYWQRFYSRSSLLQHAPGLVAGAALFLAAKVEESPRRVRDVVNVVWAAERQPMHANASSHAGRPTAAGDGRTAKEWGTHTPQAFQSPMHSAASASAGYESAAGLSTAAATAASSSASPAPSSATTLPSSCPWLLPVSPVFWALKDVTLRLEQRLLRVLGFRMTVQHPQPYVLWACRQLEASAPLSRLALCVANDSARSPLCLQYSAPQLAAACVLLASELTQEPLRFSAKLITGASSQQAHAQNSKASAANSSPYRSPLHPSSSGYASTSAAAASALTSPPGAPSSSSVSSASSSLLISSAHSVEWWETLGGVSQLQLEDCAQQLLQLYDDEFEEQQTVASMAAAAAGGTAGTDSGTPDARTVLGLLDLIALDAKEELRQEASREQARMQRIQGSARR